MNWSAITFDWNQVRAFLATAEEGSLSAAARAVGLTQPTLGRQISALEEELGVVLFDRSKRRLSLTASGQELLDHVRVMGEAAARVSMIASRQAQEVEGEVAITATDLFSAAFLPEILKEIRKSSPGLRFRVVVSDNIKDLGRREADIAIRHVRPEEPELIAKRVVDMRGNLYASTEYLDQMGRPKDLSELCEHKLLGAADVEKMLAVFSEIGFELLPENVVVASDSYVLVWELVRAGLGMAMLPEKLADRTPGLEKVLEAAPYFEFPVWLVAHKELHASRRIRIVFDALDQALRMQ